MVHDHQTGPIGVFDSGYGGLTVLTSIRQLLPQYCYYYLGDNARTPYGNRSFELVYQFTLQAVRKLFDMGCPLVILACNTASAKALRTIQQHDLPRIDATRRVLGVIRPTTEAVASLTRTHHVGILATTGTVLSQSYDLEIQKLHPHLHVVSQSCPMWVPLVENNMSRSPGADYFIKLYLDALLAKDPDIDTIILGCTHYPLLIDKIRTYLPSHIHLMPQGQYVADSLLDYFRRHPDMESRCAQGGGCTYFTTDRVELFQSAAGLFLPDTTLDVRTVHLET